MREITLYQKETLGTFFSQSQINLTLQFTCSNICMQSHMTFCNLMYVFFSNLSEPAYWRDAGRRSWSKFFFLVGHMHLACYLKKRWEQNFRKRVDIRFNDLWKVGTCWIIHTSESHDLWIFNSAVSVSTDLPYFLFIDLVLVLIYP